MIRTGNWSHVVQALRYRDHRLFNATLFPAVISLWGQRTGIGWLTWELTHSPTWLGIVAAADLLPGIFILPFAGVTADRAVPLKMMRLTQGIIMVHALILCVLTVNGWVNVWILFALSLVTGFNQPYAIAGRMVFFPTLVPKEELGTAIAINSTIFNTGRAVGPALAGLMIGPFGVAAVFFLNFVAFVAHLVNLFRIRPVRVERQATQRRGMLTEVAEGLRYTARHPGIGPLLLLLVVASMMSRPLGELLPGFADQVFARGPQGLGWLLTAMGVGGLFGAIWLTRRAPVKGLTNVVLSTTLVMGLALPAFALVENFSIALVFLVILGFMLVVSGTGTQALMHTAVAGEFRGRVLSLYAVVFRGVPAIGAIALGLVAEVVGLGPAVAGAGLICVLAWAAALPRRKALQVALEAPPKE
ncbi:MAG: MFS transporter [Alphaproteobacteria bacterium]|nr:MFS transporter [Alphaproteobacteria bacterium]MCZ6495361.1 MFS transporter [Alphaproteobacteria bacterium]MCZ6608829.1 MFS transporter [Alphaproteobacteria bacterium]MCZ6740902.1 MFS transporter [Alphaproteobacteria bacterium]MCZ6813768.1 MFS transporter [Alphaproteobacteria bacterium]